MSNEPSPVGGTMIGPQDDVSDAAAEGIGVVVIGRNEAPRLPICLVSLQSASRPVVYVDSGSVDDSIRIAEEHGAVVEPLDLTQPFTAARARNVGFKRLLQLAPEIKYVQFVDGDCEVVAGWFAAGVQVLDERPEVAVVCGLCQERFPLRSVYNLLCDMSWNGPAGDASACGGNALMRVDALRQVGGFNSALIAGEEPELCLRLRGAGHKIHRLDVEMVLHDADIRRFSQWWRRTVRTGHAFAEVSHLHRQASERLWTKEARSAILWGGCLPLAFLVLLLVGCWYRPSAFMSLGIPLVYILQFLRISRGRRKQGDAWRASMLYALFCLLGKLPECLGVVTFRASRMLGKQTGLIEYKS